MKEEFKKTAEEKEQLKKLKKEYKLNQNHIEARPKTHRN